MVKLKAILKAVGEPVLAGVFARRLDVGVADIQRAQPNREA
jgi:hypothetical protein